MAEPRYKYGGDSAIGALLLPERREILQEEQNQFIGYDDRGQAIVQTLPAQYGESEVDFSYSPIVRGAKATGSFLSDIFFGDANEQSEAAGRAVSAVRGVAGGLVDYAVDQYRAGMAGGTTYDPETRQITEFDPTAVLLSNAPAGIQAVRNAPPNTMTLGAAGGRMNPELIEVGSVSFDLRKRALSGDESAISELMRIDGLDRNNVLRRAQNAVTKAESNFQAMGGRTREEYRKSIYGDKTKEEFIEESNRERFREIEEVSSNDYRGDHQPPDREYGAPLNDLTSMIPEDIYSPAGTRLYGFGNPSVDTEAFEALRAARGNPRAEVLIYRAVPQDVNDINSGDWVTTSRAYADMHGENALGGNYQVLEQKARAGDLYSEGYPYEFGFNPLDMSQGARMQRAQDLEFDTERTAYRGLSGEYDPNKAGNYQMFTSSPEDAGEYGSNVVSSYLRKGNNLVVEGGRNNFNSIPVRNLPDAVRANLHSSVGSVARTDDIAYAAQAAGYDSVSINNVFDKASNEIPLKPPPASNAPMSQEMMDLLDEVDASGMLNNTPNVALPPEIPRNYDPTTIDIIFDPKNIRSIEAEFDPTKADSADLLSSRQSERQMSALRGIA